MRKNLKLHIISKKITSYTLKRIRKTNRLIEVGKIQRYPPPSPSPPPVQSLSEIRYLLSGSVCDTIEAPSTFKNCLRFPYTSLKIPVICCSKSVSVTRRPASPWGKRGIYIFSQLFTSLSHK